MTIEGVQIAHLTSHYRLIAGAWYRDAWAVRPDGSLRPVSVLAEVFDQ